MSNNLMNLNLKLTINQMIISNIHIGHSKKFLNVNIKPFLLGYRNNVSILNIFYSPIQMRIVINFFINIISLRQRILIVKDRDIFNFRNFFYLKNIYFFDSKWVGGTLTNFRKVRRSSKLKENNNILNSINSMRYLPSAVFFFDIDSSKWAAIEAFNLDIPVVSVVDSNTMLFSYINYPIIGNNKSFEALYLYTNIIRNAILKGYQKEMLNILQII